MKAKKIVYDENNIDSIKKQKKGIDGQVLLDYEVKSLRHDHKSETRILLETISVVKKNIPGWLFTNESDVIVLVYWDDEGKTQFYKGCFLFPKILRKWFLKNRKKKYKIYKISSERKGYYGYWDTKFILVPKDDLPKNSYKVISSDLFTKKENMTLSSFIKSLQDETSFDNFEYPSTNVENQQLTLADFMS